jgi:hypothetical protein
MVPSEEMPDVWQEERGACGHEAKEEDDDSEMLLIHEVVAQTGGAIGDATIGELDIERPECRRYAVYEEAVEEADGCVAAFVSPGLEFIGKLHTERLVDVRRRL